jgi:outer membrane protein assembly factor BamB
MFGGSRAVPALVVVLAGVVVACGHGNSSSPTGTPVSLTPYESPPAGGSSSTSVTIDAKGPQLVALDVADGHVRWVGDLSKVTYGLAAIDGLVVEDGADACGETQATGSSLARGDGAEVWSVKYPQPGLSGRPGFAAADGVVVVSEAKELVAFALQDGSERWRQPFPAAPRPSAAGDLVVVAAESDPPVSARRSRPFI